MCNVSIDPQKKDAKSNDRCLSPNLFAVLLVHFSTFYGFGATVATIIITAFVVIFVVAIAVSLVLRRSACGSGRWTLVIRIAALALQKIKHSNTGMCHYHIPHPPYTYARAFALQKEQTTTTKTTRHGGVRPLANSHSIYTCDTDTNPPQTCYKLNYHSSQQTSLQ